MNREAYDKIIDFSRNPTKISDGVWWLYVNYLNGYCENLRDALITHNTWVCDRESFVTPPKPQCDAMDIVRKYLI